jgi:uncharacterized glyoxalase superfamily protein PhnB
MALTNSERQARHRHYKQRAIEWYERATGFTIKEVMEIMKFADLPEDRRKVLSGTENT